MTNGSSANGAGQASPWTYAGLFMVTLSTLMYEIVLTRIFSVTMWYHFAFLAISVALFGMTVGALIVHLAPERFRDADIKRHLWRFSLLFGVSIAISFVTQLSIPVIPHWSLIGVYSVVLTCVVISVPFILSGIVVCLSLTRFPGRVNRLYAADLVGAALGCVLIVLLVNRMDGPSAVIAIGALGSVGALMFAGDARSARGAGLAVTGAVLLGGFSLINAQRAHDSHPILRIVWAKEHSEPVHLYEKWNSFSRVTVDYYLLTFPNGWGLSRTLPTNTAVNQLSLVIDGAASTVLTQYTGDRSKIDFLRYDVTNLVHYIRPQSDVLVVGVGGGRDVLSALAFDQRSVTGIELNKSILDMLNGRYGDFTGHLDRDQRVTFVNDEARSYITRSDKKYDIIQISLIDTWAAGSAGAFALSENTLYTTEAWQTFLDHLKPGGVLSVTRWYKIGDEEPLETYRMVALASKTLKDRGVENPRDHMVVYQAPTTFFNSSVATLLVSPQPLRQEDLADLKAVTARLDFPMVLTPDSAIDAHFAGLVSPAGPEREVAAFSEDISPPTDNRPFFFQMANLKTFFDGTAFSDSHVLQPALVLGMLSLAVLGLTAGCIVLPLLVTTGRSAHSGMFPFYTYFAGIGLGFLLIEISQLQRLTIFLGHPTYALTVVLFAVLLSSGIGSMLSERFARPNRPATLLVPMLVLMAAMIVFGLATPVVISHTNGETTPIRILTALGLVMPLGLLMGMLFPIGMSVASRRPGAPTSFLWGINGATSVCGSVLGIVVAMLWGISAAFWMGWLSYAVAIACMAVITLRPAAAGVSIEPPALQGETSIP